MRFVNISLENWKNFADCDVELRDRVFLVGLNASGKSNFLDTPRFLHDVSSIGGGFQEAVTARRGGVSRLRCLAARKYSDILIRVSVENEEASPRWTYELRFNQDNRQRAIVKSERVQKDGSDILHRPDRHDQKDPERLTQTYLEQVNANQEFRELANFFTSVRYLHLVPQLV